MREYIEQATYDISVGLDPDVVINALLLEKSVWKPSNRVDVPFLGRKKIPGGLTGLGAAAYGAYKGHKAHKEAKAQGLKGKEKAKHVAKGVVKGAAKGAVAGYGAQLAQRASRASQAKGKHTERRTSSFWVTAKTDEGKKYYRGTGVLKKTGDVAKDAAAKEAALKKAQEVSKKVRRRGERQSNVHKTKEHISQGALGLASAALRRARGK